jgi:nucleotide-binding universal stress UspA family protein
MFKKILFPVDLGEASALAAPYVDDAVEKFGAELHVLFVTGSMETKQAILYGPYPYEWNTPAEINAQNQLSLAAFIEAFFRHKPVKAGLASGDPTEKILEYAERHDIDLIIMGTHGRRGMSWLLHGSITEKIIESARVPVMTVNLGYKRDKLHGPMIRLAKAMPSKKPNPRTQHDASNMFHPPI